jgi:hypothetical protein
MKRVVAVVGNPNPGGRTTTVAEAVARKVTDLCAGPRPSPLTRLVA